MFVFKRGIDQGIIFCIICFQVLAITAQDPPMLIQIWMVTEGEHQTYLFKKIYDYDQVSPNQIIQEYSSPSGETNLLIYKEGMKITFTITSIEEEEVLGNMQLNQSCIVEMSPPVSKTIANRTYWENEYADLNTTIVINDLIVTEEEYSSGGYTTRSLYKWNWKTGWMEYSYFSERNEAMLLYELEIENITTTSKFPPNLIFGVVFLTGIGVILGIRRFQSK